MKETKQLRLDSDAIAQIDSIWGDFHGHEGYAASQALRAYARMRRSVLPKVKKVFSRAEMTALLHIHNGIIYESQFSTADFLKTHLEDAEQYDGISAMFGCDISEMKEKIDQLTDCQVFFLIEDCQAFWHRGEEIEDFLK